MKLVRLFCVIAFSLCIQQIKAQIVMDKKSGSGRVIVSAQKQIVTKLAKILAIKTLYYTSDTEKLLSIGVVTCVPNNTLYYKKNSLLLIKFSDDTRVELHAIADSEPQVFNDNYQTHTNYSLPWEEAEAISKKEIVKIRVFSDKGYLDFDIKGNKFSKKLAQDLVDIQDRLDNYEPYVPSITDGF